MEGKYPKSGFYRVHKSEITNRLERYQESLLTDEVINKMFPSLDPEGYEQKAGLSPEEHSLVKAFISHAAERVLAGAVTSHIARREFESKQEISERTIGSLAPRGFAHDMYHAAVRYSMTKGESLVPVYTKLENNEQQYTDPEALEEEMIVELLEPGQPIDHAASILLYGRAAVPKKAGWFNEYAMSLEELRDSDPFALFWKLHRARFLMSIQETILEIAGDDPTINAQLSEFEIGKDKVLDNPSPEYMRLVRAFYDNLSPDSFDPKFGFNQFRTMIEPLLPRLASHKDT